MARQTKTDPLLLRTQVKMTRVRAEIVRASRSLTLVDGAELQAEITDALVRDVAYALHNVDNGMEAILEDIPQEVDGSAPKGNSEHRALLDQTSLDTSDRPALIGPDILNEVEDLRRFRHAYGMDLRKDEVARKFRQLDGFMFPAFQRSLGALQDRLEEESPE